MWNIEGVDNITYSFYCEINAATYKNDACDWWTKIIDFNCYLLSIIQKGFMILSNTTFW